MGLSPRESEALKVEGVGEAGEVQGSSLGSGRVP